MRQPRNSPTRYPTRRYQRKIVQLNPFTPEPPVRIHVPSTACDVIRRWTRATLSANACRVKTSFKPYQNEHNSVKDTGEKGKKTMRHWPEYCHENLVPLPTYPFLSPNPKILKAFLKTFPTKIKPTKCPAKETKWGKKIEKREEERKRKVKVTTAASLLNPRTLNFAFCACANFTS